MGSSVLGELLNSGPFAQKNDAFVCCFRGPCPLTPMHMPSSSVHESANAAADAHEDGRNHMSVLTVCELGRAAHVVNMELHSQSISANGRMWVRIFALPATNPCHFIPTPTPPLPSTYPSRSRGIPGYRATVYPLESLAAEMSCSWD
jgi:hypothetical protein